MSTRERIWFFVVFAYVACGGMTFCYQTLSAQPPQVLVETPLQRNSNSFYENFGVGWSFSNDNISINVPNGVRPPFGLGDPNADARLRANFNGPGGGRFGLNLTMGQGSTRTRSLESPSVVIPNGGSGAIFDGSLRPFVTSFIPVVGDGFQTPVYGYGYVTDGVGIGGPNVNSPTMVSPLQQRLQQMAADGTLANLGQLNPDRQTKGSVGSAIPEAPGSERPVERKAVERKAVERSTAESGDISVAEIKRQRQSEPPAYLTSLEKAKSLEEAGKPFSARQQYRRAAELAPEERKSDLWAEYRRLDKSLRE